MKVAILIYPGFTSLDAVGPFEVFSRLPDADVQFVSVAGGQVVADQPHFSLPSVPLDQVRDPDLVVVAGGSTTQEYLGDPQLLTWMREAHERTTWTTSVCTGSLLLGAAGLLEGGSATSHWYELESIAEFGASRPERVVEYGRVMTSAGVHRGSTWLSRCADASRAPCTPSASSWGSSTTRSLRTTPVHSRPLLTR